MGGKEIRSEMYAKWDDLRLTQSFQKSNSPYHTNIIVGIINTGICPNMKAFSDEDLEPLPSYKIWRGGINVVDFNCNKKIMGSKVYAVDEEKGYNEIFDYAGHGTYISTIACGDFLVIGRENIVRGGMPKSRIAMYKFHNFIGCCMNPAIFDAIRDGVDLLCMAVSVYHAKAYDKEGEKGKKRSLSLLHCKLDDISLATLYATVKGVLYVTAAGNYTIKGSVTNYVPWQLCVGACTRNNCEFAAVIKLGDGKGCIKGYSKNPYSTGSCLLIHEDNARLEASSNISSKDKPTFDPIKVHGKILICKGYRKGQRAKSVGAKGMIVVQRKRDENQKIDSRKMNFPLSPTIITRKEAKILQNYVAELKKNQREATAEICACVEEIIDDSDKAPTLLPLSSRGSALEQDILKPNICAPGELFIPSIPHLRDPKGGDEETPLTLVSGTSASTAFAAGAAGFIKSVHPDWSPAIMTTASPMRKVDDTDAYGIGNGLIDPLAAIDPGLVYDVPVEDWVRYLRWGGCTDNEIHQDIDELIDLVVSVKGSKHVRDLNLPSLSAAFSEDETRHIFIRRLKNITEGASIYECKVEPIEGLDIQVDPKVLFFEGFEDEKNFTLEVKVIDWSKSCSDAFSTFLEWQETNGESETESDSDSKQSTMHIIRSHILITKRTPYNQQE